MSNEPDNFVQNANAYFVKLCLVVIPLAWILLKCG